MRGNMIGNEVFEPPRYAQMIRRNTDGDAVGTELVTVLLKTRCGRGRNAPQNGKRHYRMSLMNLRAAARGDLKYPLYVQITHTGGVLGFRLTGGAARAIVSSFPCRQIYPKNVPDRQPVILHLETGAYRARWFKGYYLIEVVTEKGWKVVERDNFPRRENGNCAFILVPDPRAPGGEVIRWQRIVK